ncbi:DUF2971 domain-containing protein [Muricoccus vinaceus]|uniref:DUF2971 domain-containing protein n=1 Tax=Muricoccus vinaceus TaxID=424704 RepID=A0ABV6IVB1_9PROT
MSDEQPTHFFKYRSLGDAKDRTRSIIADSKIWFSRPMDFNDPFDCAPGFSMAAPPKVFRDYMMKLFREKAPTMSRPVLRAQLGMIQKDSRRRQNSPEFLTGMREATWRSVNTAGVLSLSARADSVLMWSHYSASHTGICLRFSSAEWAFPFRAAQRVRYCAERPIVNPVLDDADTIVDKSILSKADFWAYEREWRILSHPGSPVRPGGGFGLITYAPKALDGIVLGARISDADAAEVASWVRDREHPVELLRAVPNPGIFRLDIVPA